MYRPALLLFSFQRSIQQLVSEMPTILRIAAASATLTQLNFKVKLYFLAAFFILKASRKNLCKKKLLQKTPAKLLGPLQNFQNAKLKTTSCK